MLKKLLSAWLSSGRCLSWEEERMLTKGPPSSLEEVLAFLRDLLGQPISEETKDELTRNIDWLSSAIQGLREENRSLRESLRRNKKHVTFSPRSNYSRLQTHIPLYSGGSGLVDLVRKQGGEPLGQGGRLAGGRTPVRRPEPLRSRNSREPAREAVKFCRYPPLPALPPATPNPPRLLRQRTYDVIEPVFVKGPLQLEKGKKLPELKKAVGGRQTTVVTRPNLVRPQTQLPVPKRTKGSENRKADFNPSTLAPPSDIPTNVFWFPI